VVRDQHFRRKKFEAKIDGSVAETRFDAYATPAKNLHEAMATILVGHEETVKTDILEPAGIPVNELPFYLDAMREFCRVCRNFTSQTRTNECYNVYLRWKAKNLDNNCLVLMAVHCGCALMEYYET